VPGPKTFYRDVLQLPPGTLLTVGADGRTSMRRYWRLEIPREREVRQVGEAAAAARVRELVTDAVGRRLVSDVPLGAFLSGGIDSTVVVGLMSRLGAGRVRTFTVGFDGDAAYDETAAARLTAQRFGTDHTEFRVTASAIDLVDPLIWHHDGPFGDSSAVPTYLVSKLTREHVTVVLTGDGGDELFAGYDRFYAALVSERIPGWIGAAARGALRLLPSAASDRHWSARARRFARPLGRPLAERVASWNSSFLDDLPALLRPDFVRAIAPVDSLQPVTAEAMSLEGRSPLGRLLHTNFTSYLADDLLVKVDRCTMANSLEARAPLLDRALTEYVAALPDDLKLRRRRSKYVLRRAFADLIPPEIAARRKSGFGAPVGAWFRGELRGHVHDLLLAPDARYADMLDRAFVAALVERHLAGRTNAGPQLWTLMCFERWLRLLPDWTRRAASG
jgi:asparagine synthase (glutamine-hydrolysing)